MKAGLLAIVIATLSLSTQAGEKGKWVKLFDGQTLRGWTQKNGTATYAVKDGTIVGTTTEGSPNSFLCSDQDYGNFEFEVEVKVDNSLNSGIQIRSQTKTQNEREKKSGKLGRVNGPQVEIAAGGTGGSPSGYLYGEATGRGWLTPDDRRKSHQHFQRGEWNKYRIVAKGARIQTWINGEQIDDLTDKPIFETHPKGFIGLQVHGIKKGTGPFQVAWRNIRIRELK